MKYDTAEETIMREMTAGMAQICVYILFWRLTFYSNSADTS